ncbi:bifunctional folylpolyglutamate synthase/dihydrofolate synthase [Ruminococcaceae bacterium OttesenSCG-928-I18]|nr:bifunctional folylpolyglutamate synthase/dihydrofolate synthase [Ruminococcaceae bacterium OttesenSCG-928-I18]
MNRENAIEYISNVSWRESRLGLQRISALLQAMEDPQKQLHFIHVAGTNGKGSVCTMLASVLTAAGYRTGLFTSPFVNCFNERMQVDGRQIEDGELTLLTKEVQQYADAMEDHPTEFELVTAIGLLYFKRRECDLVVLEVGLGGRLDATNVIPPPLLAVITSIGLDHTAELGDSLWDIAAEKGGIIKPGSEVVLAPQQPLVEKAMDEICRQNEVPLHRTDFGLLEAEDTALEGQYFSWGEYRRLHLPLFGAFQLPNAATVLTALEVLAHKGFPVDETALRKGLGSVRWPARLELLAREPVFLLDGGHNEQAVNALAESLESYYPGAKWHFLVGVMADKAWKNMLETVYPLAQGFLCVTPDTPRALSAEVLATWLRSQGTVPVETCPSVRKGVEALLEEAGAEGLACAFGSLYMAGEIRAYFGLGTGGEKDVFV